MKNNVRKHRSSIVSDLLEGITPQQRLQTQMKMVIAARLDDLITAKGWSKGDFASKLNKHPSEITKWLGGAHNFTIDTLTEISVVLNVSVADLMTVREVRRAQRVYFVASILAERSPIPFSTSRAGSKSATFISPRSIA